MAFSRVRVGSSPSSSPSLSRNYCSGSTNPPAKTFSNQNSMPSLPVPNLKESCDKYLNSIIPIAHRLGGEQQFAQTKQIVEEFLRPGKEFES
jgi:carnitine O-acetyltransferase